MEKEFVTYTQALRLKALGFNETCFAFFNGKHLDFNVWDWEYPAGQKRRDIGECPLAPTFSQAFKWIIQFPPLNKWRCNIALYSDETYSIKDGKDAIHEYLSSEECLDKLLEFVESENK